MNKIFTLLVLLLFSATTAFSQCAETSQPKVLLIGDSWGFFMNFEQTINKVLKTWGHSNYTYVTSGNIVVNGADTYDFLEVAKQTEIQNLIDQNPSIEVVHLSIGGNDFLGDWKKSFTQAQTDTLEDKVFVRLDSIIRFLKTCKPGIRILWSGYTYPNFEEPISAPGIFTGSNHPFYGTWEGMEFPNFQEINNILTDVTNRMQDYADADPQVDFVNAVGILQYTTGQPSAICCGISPQTTYAPYTVSLPWGDPSYPSPMVTMRDYIGLAKDCYHLSPGGYADFVGYHAQKFYQKFLMDDMFLLSENNAQTGSVSSTGNVSGSLYVGESGGEEFSTVLSFNTTNAPDTTLEKASIFIRRQSLSGTNPISSSFQVSVKNGSFGTTADVEAADFTAVGDATAAPCIFGSNVANGDWIRLDLPSQILPFINNNNSTQFVLSASGFTGGRMTFYNASNPDFAPVLNLDYTGTASAINELEKSHFTVYPNPANQLLTIKTNGEVIQQIELADLLGQIVMKQVSSASSLDISTLPSGMYILNVTTKTGRTSKRIVKM